MSHYNILSLDGGGVKGIITAHILSWVEKEYQKISNNPNARLVELFDFFAGTSAGGILVTGYLMPNGKGDRPRFSAEEVESFFEEAMRKVFRYRYGSLQKHWCNSPLTRAKYSDEKINRLLKKQFGNMELSQLLKPCLITAYDLPKNRIYFFRQHRAKKQPKHNFYLRDICRATSSGPTYFPPPIIESMSKEREHLFVDGGIYANNPALFSYAELRSLDNQTGTRDMLMLSIGTGEHVLQYDKEKIKDWMKWQWIEPLIELMLNGNISNTEVQMEMVFHDHDDHYLRLDPCLPNKETDEMDLADEENINKLLKIAEDYVKRNAIQLSRFIEKLHQKNPTRAGKNSSQLVDISAKPPRLPCRNDLIEKPHTIDLDQYPNITSMVEEACEKYDNSTALEQSGDTFTYRKCHADAEHLASWLQHVINSQQPKDSKNCKDRKNHIAIMMPNCPQYIISIFAILRIGAVVVNINPKYTKPELEHILEQTKPQVILYSDSVKAIVSNRKSQLIPKHQVLVNLENKPSPEETNITKWLDAIEQGKNMVYFRPRVDKNDLAFIQFTGENTDNLKAAMLTHHNLITNVLQVKASMSQEFLNEQCERQNRLLKESLNKQQERQHCLHLSRLICLSKKFLNQEEEKEQRIAITASSLYRIPSLIVNGLLFFHLGVRNILIADTMNSSDMIEVIHKHPPHSFSGTYTSLKSLISASECPSTDFGKLMLIFGEGIADEESFIDNWQETIRRPLIPLIQTYGLTEASPIVTVNLRNITEFKDSIGLAIPSTEAKIVDDDHCPQSVGKTGLLFVRGPQLIAHHLQKTGTPSIDLSLDGWLNTYKRGCKDQKGFIHMCQPI